MEKNFTFKNRNYSFNTETEQVSRVTEDGKVIPVSIAHPSLAGIREHVEQTVANNTI